MARKRSQALGRIVEVQRRMAQLREADLARTNRERDIVIASIEETVAAMESMSGTQLAFSQIHARRITAQTTKEQRLKGLARVQERQLRSERAKGDRLEDAMNSARAAEERESDDEELYDLLDQIDAARSAQAPRKLRDP